MTTIDAGFKREGDPAFETDPGEAPADPSSEKDEEKEVDPSPDGGKPNNPDDEEKDVPFHKHPRWTQRETEWNDKFNSQEQRHTKEIEDLRKEIAGKKETSEEVPAIPSWFGGSEEQWTEYYHDQQKLVDEAAEKAEKRATAKVAEQEKAVKEATDYMQSELQAIEADEELNPKKAKLDPNKLLKVVMDNDLIDSKGRWNYRAGWLILQSEVATPPKTNTDRKKIAGATTSGTPAEPAKPQAFKTSDDFQKSRPW